MVKKKKFRRSKNERLVAGVLGGVASYYDQDPTIVRIVWLLLLGFTGFVPGIAAYAITVLTVPVERTSRKKGRKRSS